MIWLFIALLTALSAFVATVIICGVRVKIYFDLEQGTLIADVFLLRKVHAVKYKIFECNGNFYSQVNGRELKKVIMNKGQASVEERQNGSESEKLPFMIKLKTIADTATAILNKKYPLKFRLLRAYLTIGTGDSMSTSIVVSGIIALLGTIFAAAGESVKAKTFDVGVYPNFRWQNTVLSAEADTGAGLAGIIASILKFKADIKRERRHIIQSGKRAEK